MAIMNWPMDERPRERLLTRGAQALSDAELLAILLGTGCQGKTAVDLARDLLKHFGGLKPLLEADSEAFLNLTGIGQAKAAKLRAVVELSQRYLYQNACAVPYLDNPPRALDFLAVCMRRYQREVFACVFLDSRYAVLAFEEIFCGTVDRADIYPRELVKRALMLNATNVILAHNHPSGCCEPSAADHEVTHLLQNVFASVGVQVLDHIVVGADANASFAEQGWLPSMQ